MPAIFHSTKIIKILALLGLILAGLLVFTLVIGLILSAFGAGSSAVLSAFSLNFSGESYGILAMLLGSLITAFLATIIAAPFCFGLITLLWLNLASRPLRALMRFMSGIPTVIYALCGLFVLVPFVRNCGGGAGYGIFSVSLVLAVLILPTMTILADSALAGSKNLAISAASLGISGEKAFLHIVLPSFAPSLLSAVTLSFGRALGDTMIALMLSGNAPVMADGLFSSMRTLSSHISLLTATQITEEIEFSIFLSGFLLFFMALLLSLFSQILRRKC